MKSILSSCVFALALMASTASASSLNLSDVGSADPLVAGGAANLPNSGDATEQAWIGGVVGVPLENLTYKKLAGSGGDKWQQINGSNNLFAFNLGSDPTWIMLKLGAGAPFDHYLFSNTDNRDFAVVDINELGLDGDDIGKISHVAIASDPDSDVTEQSFTETEQSATVPEPASLTLLGLGLSAAVAARRRRKG